MLVYAEIISVIDKLLLENNTIGIFVSGGFDSTLLSYLVHSRRKELNSGNTFIFYTVPRYDDSVVHAKRIIAYIDDKFDNTTSTHVILGNPDESNENQVRSGVLVALERNETDIILIADNTTPDAVPNGPIRPVLKNPKLVKPFFSYTKDVIVQLCIDSGLTDIMEISHTCTESKLLRCKECWQCKERAWAFDQCDYIDPGTM